MLGAIIGDTVGSIYESHNIHTTDFPLLGKYNHFTDDTVMTMAVAEWLLTDPERSEEKLTDCLVRWGQRFPHAGYGGAFRVWLFRPEELHTYYRDTDSHSSQPAPLSRLLEEVRRQYRNDSGLSDEHPTCGGRRPYNSFGNGSAMRVSACGWVAQSLDEALDLAKRSAEVTHNHPEGIKGAQAVAAAIYLFRRHTTKNEVRDYLSQQFGYRLDATCDQLRPARFNVSCQITLPLAFAALMDSTDFESAIRLAVSLGGDADTIACITGAMAEPLYGIPNTIERAIIHYLPTDFQPIINAIRGKEIEDCYDLQRFVEAQEGVFPTALQEIRNGKKQSHWMWYIFPQIKGLGHSSMSRRYAISSLSEAKAYLAHPILGTRLREITQAALEHSDTSAEELFGYIDQLKFQSCMTLFDMVQPNDLFRQAIDLFYNGQADRVTQDTAK